MRAFVALPLPEGLLEWMRTNRAAYASALPKLTLVPVSSCHITLRFLGELPGDKIDDVMERLAMWLPAMPGATVTLDRFGIFYRNGRPAVFWIGPSTVSQRLADLVTKIDLCLSGLGSNNRTERFSPHVTLGRFADGTLAAEVAEIKVGPLEPVVVPVTDVFLYESVMGQDHPMYVAHGSVRLASFAE